MNKKGNIFYRLMMAIVIFAAVASMGVPIKDLTADARSASNLNCDGTGLTTGERLSCIMTSLFPFVFYGLGFAASIAYITFTRKSATG